MNKSNHFDELRKKATSLANEYEGKFDNNYQSFDELLQEHEIYQIELEMQNEELKLAQENLIEAEEKYHNLYNEAPSAYISLGLDFKIQDINNTGLELFNLTPSKSNSVDFRKFILPQYQDDFYFFSKDLLKGNEASAEFSLINCAETSIDVHISGKPYYDNNQQLIGCRLIITDITKWKKQISQNSYNEERYRFISNIPDPVIVHINGIIVFFNKALTEYYGYDTEDFMGKMMFDFIYPADIEKVMINMQNKLNGLDYLREYEIRLLHKNGEVRTAIVSVTNMEFENKSSEFIFIKDITERKIAEEKIQDYASYYTVKSALRSQGQGSRELPVIKTFLNEIVKNYYLETAIFCSYSNDMLVPELVAGNSPIPINSFFINVALETIDDALFPILDEHGCVAQSKIISKIGTEEIDFISQDIELMYKIIPIKISADIFAAFLVACKTDCDASPHRLDRIVELADELRLLLLEQRQKEELDRRIIKSRNDAEELSDAKTAFLARMSHEIRSPLNPIVGFANSRLCELFDG